jgi:beta-glucosidase
MSVRGMSSPSGAVNFGQMADVRTCNSWNKDLTLARGVGLGGEFRTKGANIALGPVVGPLGRVVTSGRNWEGISPDPYLNGALAAETVTGIQSVGVITSTKHYIGNEQETNRNPEQGLEAVSSNIDDRTIHELYLWPFQDAVHAGSGNIMCSYQRINNSYGCANSKTLNGLLKTELGFQGFVVSDWGAQHAGVATALSGMDMAMPAGTGLWGTNLSDAIQNGTMPQSRVDDMATRILATWYQMGQDQGFPEPGVGIPSDITRPHEIIDARNISARPTLLQGAIEGHVLVKNIRNALPLKTPRQLSLFGYSAKVSDLNDIGGVGAWTYGYQPANVTDLLTGFFGSQQSGHSGIAPNGTLVSGGGSGATAANLVISPFDAVVQQAYADGTALYWDFDSGSPTVNVNSDACLVFANAWASEGYDRANVREDYTDGLIKNVADKCNNTIVVMHNAGIRLVDQFIDHDNVTALIFAHLPGQDTGAALVQLLYGKSNSWGRLPYTVARNESDYEDLLSPAQPEGIFAKFPQSNFSEGTLVDYRAFDARNVTPRFEFGFGLSYTSFNYSNLQISKSGNASIGSYPTGPIEPGGQRDLWDILLTVKADIRNTGTIDGSEVAQLYLGLPGAGGNGTDATPVRQLRGFAKPNITAGATASVQFDVTRRDLSVWDVVAQKWLLQNGTYGVFVGASSRDLRLNGTVSFGG